MKDLRIIDFRYILTPYATVFYNTSKGIKRKFYYVFGFKVADISV